MRDKLVSLRALLIQKDTKMKQIESLKEQLFESFANSKRYKTLFTVIQAKDRHDKPVYIGPDPKKGTYKR